MHPSLIINILSYAYDHIFLALAHMRRVSQIFNYFYQSEEIVKYESEKDLG
jgi:hypothetical protein